MLAPPWSPPIDPPLGLPVYIGATATSEVVTMREPDELRRAIGWRG